MNDPRTVPPQAEEQEPLQKLLPREVGERSASLMRVGIKHEAIMHYMLANPTQKLSEVAAHFKISISWLSSLVHSDAFQARLRDRQDQIFTTHILPLQEKLVNLAHVSIEALGDALDANRDNAEFVLDTTDKVLHRLGFAPKSTPAPAATGQVTNIQQNIYNGNVTKELLAEARAARRNLQLAPLETSLPPMLSDSSDGDSNV